MRSRRLIQSAWYQANWGDRYQFAGDQIEKRKVETDRGGHRIAVGTGGSATGEGGDRLERDEARGRVLAQVGRGFFRDDELKKELLRIDQKAADEKKRLAELDEISLARETRVLSFDWAGRLVGDLRAKLLDGELTFEKKRKFVEILCAGSTVKGSQKEPEIEASHSGFRGISSVLRGGGDRV